MDQARGSLLYRQFKSMSTTRTRHLDDWPDILPCGPVHQMLAQGQAMNEIRKGSFPSPLHATKTGVVGLICVNCFHQITSYDDY